jgi:hypothetical protein
MSVTTPSELMNARTNRLVSIVRTNARELDSDELGNPVVRGRVILIDPNTVSLNGALKSGFTVTADTSVPALSLRVVTLAVPQGLSARLGLKRIRANVPGARADYDHIYLPAGGALRPSAAKLARGAQPSKVVIGVVDGGVASHPALQGRILQQRGFAGPAKASGHGTAVASLLAGRTGAFHGAATDASLVVADIYGGRQSAGSATAIAQALGWLASTPARVINISLVGPSNELLRRAIGAVRSRGIAVVAAVGNDGPAAPPQFPASYPGVISITGVDARGVALFESGNAAHLDFAAPGADMAAAAPGSGYTRVRGTSFAAPLAAGRLAVVGSVQRLAAEARPGKGRIGRGVVCEQCRVAPQAVGAR